MFENFFPILGKIITTYSASLARGLLNTVIIAFCAFLLGIILGTLVAAVKAAPKKRNIVLKVLEKIGDIYVGIMRGTPVVVQLLLMYFAILASIGLPAIVVAILVFGLNSGAYVSEIMRAGLMSVDFGQTEAGRSLGLSYSATMFKVVLPQAIKNAVPTLLNEFITLLKETSVAGYITVIDVTMAAQLIVAREYTAAAPYILLAVIYLIIVTILTLAVRQIEKRMRKSDRS